MPGRTGLHGPGSTTLPRTCSRTRTSKKRWKREPLQSCSQGSLILIPAQNPLHPECTEAAAQGEERGFKPCWQLCRRFLLVAIFSAISRESL